MWQILFILLLTLTTFGQTVKTWTFDSFYPDSTGKHLVGEWLFSAQPERDLTAYGNDLTASGFSANFADEAVSGNPFYKDSTSLKFNGTSEFLSITSGSATDFVMTDGEDYTWAFTVYMNASYSGTVIGKGNLYYFRVANPGLNGNGWYLQWNDGVEYYTQSVFGFGLTTGNWYNVVIKWDDSDSVYTYKNGVAQGNLANAGSGNFASIGNVGASTDFYIGKIAAGQYFSSTLAYASMSNSAWTDKQIAEFGNLATGWYSKSGNVSRDSVDAWYQTFDTDTLTSAIGVASTLASNQEWYVTVTAKAKTSADTLDIYFVGKSSTQRKPVGTSWTTFTLPMGDGFNLTATDSIAIGGGADFDFDNVIVSKASHHLIRNINRWITW